MQDVSSSERAPIRVPVDSLQAADSPRLAGENPIHTRMLAEVESILPPIVVHRPSMRVIDGMHRLRAAMLRGDPTIEVRFFDGPEDAAFVIAVQSNIAHGLPLSLADREAAAVRILAMLPHWSDRAIARSTGLAPKTVASIRHRTADDAAPQQARVGRDGKVRPIDSAEGRRRAAEVIADRPSASLREIASAAGISPGTARDVRDRIRRGEDAVPVRQRNAMNQGDNTSAPRRPRNERTFAPDRSSEPSALLSTLKRDPSLRLTDAGRHLLRWLDGRTVTSADWADLFRTVPPHCTPVLATLARANAENWLQLAEELEHRGHATA